MKLEVMLDSGAFTVWKRGTSIDLHAYANFIIKHKDVWTTVVSLDVIPGRYGGPPPTPGEAERAAQQGWKNFYELKRLLEPHGITPIHVFHRGENLEHLRRLVDECEYFGLAPKVDAPTAVRAAFLDECMPLVTDDDGFPIRRFHGFGVGPETGLIPRYPFYSVDSSSWQQTGRFGSVYIPEYGQVAFSARSSKRLKFGQHFDSYPATDREVIAAYLQSKGISDPRMLREDYCLCCGKTFDGKVRHVDRPLRKPQQTQPEDPATRYYFAGNTGSRPAERRLIERGVIRRLLSFATVEHIFETAYLPVYREAMTM